MRPRHARESRCRGRAWLLATLGLWGPRWSAAEPARAAPDPVAVVENPEIREGSGLTESRTRPGRFWVINDSGHAPVLYLMDAEGRDLGSVRVEGAENRDWESLATDGEGGLWIADVGNNENMRRDLTLYRVREPAASDPLPDVLEVERKVIIRYPDQKGFPPEKHNFDCEAVFAYGGNLYFLTKHRADRDTTLYRLDVSGAGERQELRRVGRAKDVGQVTGADLHPDGRRLAVLTYSGIWIFERPEEGDHFLSGAAKVYPVAHWSMKQTEGIAWLGDDELLITNEQRQIFRMKVP